MPESLSQRIMNLPCHDRATMEERYGHRDARHAAAELALPYETAIEAARAFVETCGKEQHAITFDATEAEQDAYERLRAALEAL